MTTIADLLTPDRVLLNLRLRDKPAAIAEIARQFGQSVAAVPAGAIESALTARERLGSTGLGGGFALPHARVPGLDRFAGLFLRLGRPIPFDAIDEKPVSMIFALLIPDAEDVSHVAALAAISRCFRDNGLVDRLRAAKTPADAYGALVG